MVRTTAWEWSTFFNYWIKGDEIPNSQFRSKRSRASPVQRQRSSLRSLRSIARSTWKVNVFRAYRTFACPILSPGFASRSPSNGTLGGRRERGRVSCREGGGQVGMDWVGVG